MQQEKVVNQSTHDHAEQTNDPRLFKKLQNDIWEFRTKYAGLQIGLLAFCDKSDNKETLVIATHGFIKKVDKVPNNEIERAKRISDSLAWTFWVK